MTREWQQAQTSIILCILVSTWSRYFDIYVDKHILITSEIPLKKVALLMVQLVKLFYTPTH